MGWVNRFADLVFPLSEEQKSYVFSEIAYSPERGQLLLALVFQKIDIGALTSAGATFDDADLSGATISGADFSGAVLRGVNFNHAKIFSSRFDRVDFGVSTFDNASISDTTMRDAEIEGELIRTQFKNVDLKHRRDNDLVGCSLSNARFDGKPEQIVPLIACKIDRLIFNDDKLVSSVIKTAKEYSTRGFILCEVADASNALIPGLFGRYHFDENDTCTPNYKAIFKQDAPPDPDEPSKTP